MFAALIPTFWHRPLLDDWWVQWLDSSRMRRMTKPRMRIQSCTKARMKHNQGKWWDDNNRSWCGFCDGTTPTFHIRWILTLSWCHSPFLYHFISFSARTVFNVFIVFNVFVRINVYNTSLVAKGHSLTACNAAPPAKSNMAARGPQNERRGLVYP